MTFWKKKWRFLDWKLHCWLFEHIRIDLVTDSWLNCQSIYCAAKTYPPPHNIWDLLLGKTLHLAMGISMEARCVFVCVKQKCGFGRKIIGTKRPFPRESRGLKYYLAKIRLNTDFLNVGLPRPHICHFFSTRIISSPHRSAQIATKQILRQSA